MQKYVYIPGFMDTGKNRNISPALEIWLRDVDFKKRIEAEYIIGHSLGANFALLNWRHNKNTKLILTNPSFLKRTRAEMVIRFIRYIFSGEDRFTKNRIAVISHLFLAAKRFNCLFGRIKNKEFDEILPEISKENIIIVRGKKDVYFCDEETAQYIRKKGIELIEIENAGHDWSGVSDAALSLIK